MNNSKRGVSIIALVTACVAMIVVAAIMVSAVQKNSPFKSIEDTNTIEEVSSLQAKLEIKKMAVFTKRGKKVLPTDEAFEGMYEKIENTNYYKVNEKEYANLKENGNMYLTENFEYVFVTNKGNIYPKDISISGMQITNTVPAGYNKVTTVEEFQNMKADKNYILMNDLDFSNVKDYKPIKNFSGTFDGNGHRISNLNYRAENLCKSLDEWKEKVYNVSVDKMLDIPEGSTKEQSKQYLSKSNRYLSSKCNDNMYKFEAMKNIYSKDGFALFENTLQGSLIKNLTINNFSIAANNTVAGLVQVLGGEIRNITGNNINVLGMQKVGGLVGMSNGENISRIQSCVVNNEVKNNIEAVAFAGGIIGDSLYTDIYNTSFNGVGAMIMTDLAGGAISGSSVNGEFKNLSANTQIISLKGKYNDNYTWIGGITGYAKNCSYSACKSDVYIHSNTARMQYIGGLIGSAVDTSIVNSQAKGRISNVKSYSGGLAGSVELIDNENTEITNCNANVDISSLDKVSAGLIGSIRANDEKNNKKVTISKCYSLGNINTAVAGSGFIAWIDANVDISNSYAKSNVNVRIKDEASFIVKIDSNKAKISNTYTKGYVLCSGSSNRYIAEIKNPSSVKLKNCYYDEKEDATSNNYAVPLKSGTMTKQDFFKGFDFRNVWTTKADSTQPELIK